MAVLAGSCLHSIYEVRATVAVLPRDCDRFPFTELPEVRMSERNVRVVVHRYRAEQAVEFFPASGIDRKARGQYTVVRLLPMEGAIPQYRLKNETDGHERVVCENELRSL
jgi:hypothetical protein